MDVRPRSRKLRGESFLLVGVGVVVVDTGGRVMLVGTQKSASKQRLTRLIVLGGELPGWMFRSSRAKG